MAGIHRHGIVIDRQAMLIQADWFEPDAPELAPGVAVAQEWSVCQAYVLALSMAGQWRSRRHRGMSRGRRMAGDLTKHVVLTQVLEVHIYQ